MRLEGSVGGDGKTRVGLQVLRGMEAQRGRLFVSSPPEGHVESRRQMGEGNTKVTREMKAMSIREAELSRSSSYGVRYIIRANAPCTILMRLQ